MEMLQPSISQPSGARNNATAGLQARPKAIFCKGLAKGTSERCIAGLFHNFGTVVDCQIARHRSGRSAGFAIIVFETHEQAVTALQAMDNATFMGRKLNVRWYQPEQDGPANPLLLGLASAVELQGLSSVLAQPHLLEQLLNIQQQPVPPLAVMSQHAASGQAHATWSNQVHGGTPAAVEPESEPAAPQWSTMVNHWLQDYLNQEAPMQHMAGTGSLSNPGAHPTIGRRSFDASSTEPDLATAVTAVERRRSTRDSLSRCLDSLNLDSLDSLAPEPASLSKSRLTTKWRSTQGSGGGAASPSAAPNSPDAAAAPAAAAAAAPAATTMRRPSDEFHMMADIKLLPSPGAAFPSSLSTAACWAVSKPSMTPSAPCTTHTTPSKPVHRNSSWSSIPDSARCQCLDQAFREAAGPAGPQQQQQLFQGGALLKPLPPMPAMHTMLPSSRGPRHHSQHTSPTKPVQAAANSIGQQIAGLGFTHGLGGMQQFQQLNVLQQAQDQYVTAMQQLTSAHSQVLAAAAALQDAGILAPQLQGMAAAAAAPGLSMPHLPPMHAFAAPPMAAAAAAANAYVTMQRQTAHPLF